MSGRLIDHEKEKPAVSTGQSSLKTETIEARRSTAHVGTVPAFLKWSVLACGVLFAVILSSLFVVNRELPGFIRASAQCTCVRVSVYRGPSEPLSQPVA